MGRRKATLHNLWSFLVIYLYWGVFVLAVTEGGLTAACAQLAICVPAAFVASLCTNFGPGKANRWIANGLVVLSGVLAWLQIFYLMDGGVPDVPKFFGWIGAELDLFSRLSWMPWYLHAAFLLPIPVYIYLSPFIGYRKKPWRLNAAWVVCAFVTELLAIGLMHLVR